jgi:hypothetical protein
MKEIDHHLMNEKQKQQLFFNAGWILFFLLGCLAMREFLLTNILAYVPASNLLQSKRFLVYLASGLALLAGWIAYFFLRSHALAKKLWKLIQDIPSFVKIIIGVALISSPGLIMWMLPLPEDFTLQAWAIIFLLYCAALLVSTFINGFDSVKERALLLAALMLAGGFGYGFFSRINQVTDYPFTTYWSEGNRFFDYSTLLGNFRYIRPDGEAINAFISWGMALPWAIPFLVPNISIGFYRLWYQLVWILPAMILGYTAIDGKLNKRNYQAALVFAMWTYLFLDQGPIYPPLVIAAIVTVIAVRQRLPVGVVLIAMISYYVRTARWTWAYAPGLWAGMLAVLAIENPSPKKESLKQLVKPVALGLAGYFGGQLLPSLIRVISGRPSLSFLPNVTTSTTRQPLLWDRLWPNPTYPPGILLGLVWAVLPAVIFIIMAAWKKHWKFSWIQKLSAGVVAAAFLIVGIIASTKIGGGSNLHNLDMFLMTIFFILSVSINAVMKNTDTRRSFSSVMVIAAIALLIAPITYTLRTTERLTLPPAEKVEESLNAVRNKVEEYSTQGEILFIDHRQLLTFNLVKNVPLIDEYEKKMLMDDALTGKSDVFSPFYDDLASHRFALIVNEPLNLIVRGEDYAFGEENDAYVKWVTIPLLCQYEPLYTSNATMLELLIPRATPAPSYLQCEGVFSDYNAQ